MRRREFIALIGSAAVSWPCDTRAQKAGKLPTIGYLGGTTAVAENQWTAAFVQRLSELGWIEGRTVAIEYHWAEGRNQRASEIASEFVRLKVDIIITGGTALVIAAKQATSTIPIVFATAGDPVAAGLVASLARPGGNITGLSVQATDLAGKKVEMLREVVPGLRRLAIMANVGSPAGVLQMRDAQAAARRLAIEVAPAEIRRAEDIGPAIEEVRGHVDALYVANEPLVFTHRDRISALAMTARLPTMHGSREHVELGGLISYAPSFPDLYRRAAEYVDKILRGTKPADIPVEQPTKFELVINRKTAKALGLEIPPTLLALADEVID
jgi:putative ABC transport system substrate-binding protein